MNEKSDFRMQTVEIKKQQMKYNYIFSKKCWFSRVLTFADLFTKLVKTPDSQKQVNIEKIKILKIEKGKVQNHNTIF